MKRHNRKPHSLNLLQPVKSLQGGEYVYGIIISKIHKLPKNARVEEPYYLISGFGSPIWENSLETISDSEWLQLQEA